MKKSFFKIACLICSIYWVSSNNVYGNPPEKIPDHLFDEFTRAGEIELEYHYVDNSSTTPINSSAADFHWYLQKALAKENYIHAETDHYIYQVLNDLCEKLVDKEVAIISDIDGFYESVILSYNAHPTVVTDKQFNCHDNKITYTSMSDCLLANKKFDYILSVSKVASYGLGSFGEPINPNGDIDIMKFCSNILKDNGHLIISIPVGHEKIVWNSTRVYGEKRLRSLFYNWKVKKYYGFTSEHLRYGVEYLPVFLLSKKR